MASMASMASQSWRNPLRSSCVGRMPGRWRRFYDRRFAAGAVAKSGGGFFGEVDSLMLFFLGGKNGSRLKETSGRTDMKDE